MQIRDFLTGRRQEILSRWCDLIISSYPEQTALFLKKERDRFANPVGAAIAAMAVSVLDNLSVETGPDSLPSAVDDFIKIRAVQDYPPSEAVKFILLLKQAVMDSIPDPGTDPVTYKVYRELDSMIDEAALQVFDKYMQCREKLNEIRIHEIKGRSQGTAV